MEPNEFSKARLLIAQQGNFLLLFFKIIFINFLNKSVAHFRSKEVAISPLALFFWRCDTYMISKEQFWKIAGVTQHIQFE
ncbi:hypothetical protein CYJ90_09170, partial [Lactobacillus jensenii]